MATRNRGSRNTSAPAPGGNEEPVSVAGLREFSFLIDEFAAAVNAELGEAGQAERQTIGQVFRDTLAAETNSIRDLFREVVAGLPADGKTDVEIFWRSSGASIAMAGARRAIQDGTLARRSVLEWIKLILELIKKIIAAILAFIKKHFPWLIGLIKILTIILGLLHILDNILGKLNELLAGREPVDMARQTREMWQGLETFWRAEAAFMRLGSSEADRRDDVLSVGNATV